MAGLKVQNGSILKGDREFAWCRAAGLLAGTYFRPAAIPDTPRAIVLSKQHNTAGRLFYRAGAAEFRPFRI